MRILIDLQGAQTESRFRGIGRYSLELTKAIVRNQGEHEILIALNGLFPETIEHIRSVFHGLLPRENIRIFDSLGPVKHVDSCNHQNRQIGEILREGCFACLKPDVVLITSLFEGWGDNAITSAKVFDKETPVVTILYDLIPLISPDKHFETNKVFRDYYYQKISHLTQSKLLLAISDSAKQEAIKVLKSNPKSVINISSGYDTFFRRKDSLESEKLKTLSKFGIHRPFVMYTGGADERKNLYRLISAFSKLPAEVRKKHQLVFVGKMPEFYIESFINEGLKCGLKSDDFVVAGYVKDADLRTLYNNCKLFVFPSLHEGFGMPPLEAMACGAPVIAASATSLLEVVGFEEALFDPLSMNSISQKMEQALVDDDFRNLLVRHGLSHVNSFSWDKSAKRTIKALEDLNIDKCRNVSVKRTSIFSKQSKRILLIKLDHMGDLVLSIPAISKLKSRYPYATIDIVVGSWNAGLAKALNVFANIYTYDYFSSKSSTASSIKNSQLSKVLNDLSDYDIAIDFRRQADTRFFLTKVNSKVKVGYETWDGDIDSCIDILLPSYRDEPHHLTPNNKVSISIQMLQLVDSLPDDVNDFVFFPELKETDVNGKKCTEVAIFPNAGNQVRDWGRDKFQEFIILLSNNPHVNKINLYFASKEEEKLFGVSRNAKIYAYSGLEFPDLVQSLSSNKICIANNSFGAHIGSYLGILTMAVYAGQESVEEWGPVFQSSYAIYHNVDCSPCHIPDRSKCNRKMQCLDKISVDSVYCKVDEALELTARSENSNSSIVEVSKGRSTDKIVEDIIDAVTGLDLNTMSKEEIIKVSQCISSNCFPFDSKKQLLVDVSEIVNFDAKTGIQRVVRNLLKGLFENTPEDMTIRPVYSTGGSGYFYANNFINTFLDRSIFSGGDSLVEYKAGDVFLGLDLQLSLVPINRDIYQKMRRYGVQVQFVVYDLLPVLMPQYFPKGTAEGYTRWLEVVLESDGVICISETVSNEVRHWMEQKQSKVSPTFKISWFHLGGDMDMRHLERKSKADDPVLRMLQQSPGFLMVGTVEPRKGHAQVIEAFEKLWKEGLDFCLVIVGQQGWMSEKIVEKLQKHPKYSKKLFWLDSASDELLEALYRNSICLIAASRGEGFGLPLVEAAKRNLSIIARDIPVFREVLGKCAYYYNSDNSDTLALAIQDWFELYKQQQQPKPELKSLLTWRESSEQLLLALEE